MIIGIRFKIISFISILLIAVISFLSFFILDGISVYQKNEAEALLINDKNLIEQYLNDQFFKYKPYESQEEMLQSFSSYVYDRYWGDNTKVKIYDVKGNAFVNIREGKNNVFYENKDKVIEYMKSDKIIYIKQDKTISFFSPLKYNKEIVAILQIDYANEKDITFYNKIKSLLSVVGAGAIGIGIILGALYFLRLTRDILKVNDCVSFIENGQYDKVTKLNRRDELGHLSRGIKYMSDSIEKNISNLNEEKKNLKLAVDKLDNMAKEQKQFINSVTHEFKTPIAAIKAYGDLLNMYGKEDKELVGEAGVNICKETERLKNMVDKILNLSSVEKYDFELRIKKTNIKNLLEDICESMNFKAEKHDIKIICKVEDLIIDVDEQSIRHIFVNLIDNAIKYNKYKGEIFISSTQNENYCVIEVKDTGIGISDQYLEKIFEPFFRVDSEGLSKVKGTGLGLPLVKKLIERQNGEIWANSKLESGSSFFVKFYI